MTGPLSNYKIVLASNSPRRKQMLGELGVNFEIRVPIDSDESYPSDMNPHDIPEYLAGKKAAGLIPGLKESEILVTADTIVVLDDQIMNKPTDATDAFRMLRELSGKKHEVITGVCISDKSKSRSFKSVTDVYFKDLTDEEIQYYIDNFKPFDKAGAYGIQEWIGFIAVRRIEGSYFNVVGLPVQKLYEELCNFTNS
ncbi:MAG: septum formation protein Maf [Bacteroidetes bacterium GWF2_38_335]|nr:MAG: septum formation protein Maf [Bacteroidetes bacterium GWF2_38_335]OFY81536.1 MAG: septum formation protein Maf [Bacteroidetes bacterium RIFOXYA12_FULL_38_20]HBS87685.1 septum formation protein Maf [Bacteroidales bacterium]